MRYVAVTAVLSVLVCSILFSNFSRANAQGQAPAVRVNVELVQLDVAVTDNHGNYITGLQPSEFSITEDGIVQKLAVFGEGNSAPKRLVDIRTLAPAGTSPRAPSSPDAATGSDPVSDGPLNPNPDSPPSGFQGIHNELPDESAFTGANVFILFDTSNYMYHGFVFAQDSIAEFVRSLDGPDKVALYAYSRDLYRASTLTPDRLQVLRGVRNTTAGDNAALYNALLLTLKDAATCNGRKAIVVFSNGPDNASMVPPEDIREVAQSEGVPVYMIATRDARLEPVSAAVFQRMSNSTGGEAYFAKDWKEEQQAFASIREDLAHIYSIYYYPEPNPNKGWRAINVKLSGQGLQRYHVRTRSGYRPRPIAEPQQPAPQDRPAQ